MHCMRGCDSWHDICAAAAAVQDVFHVDLPELGELVAAEVGHDNSGAAPGEEHMHAVPCLRDAVAWLYGLLLC